MMHAIEAESLYGKHLLQGWSFSVLLHLVLATMIAFMMPKMTIVLEQEPFRWDVALVEPSVESTPQVSPEPAPTVEPPPAPARRAPSAPPSEPVDTVMPRVASQHSAAVVHPDLPKVPPPPPLQQVEPPPVKPAPPQESKTAEVPEPEPVNQEPVRESPMVEPPPAAPTYQASPPAVDPPPTIRQESVAQAAPPASVADTAPPAPAAPPLSEEPAPAASSAPPAPAPSEAPPVVARLAPSAPAAPPQAKADHRWVGESLWRRVAELKRYPASARLNGLEGRVVLKVIIRADGQLADVSVAKSSGHPVLDAAAMEAVKLACPLHMKQPIGPPQIVVSLPIVYSLAN